MENREIAQITLDSTLNSQALSALLSTNSAKVGTVELIRFVSYAREEKLKSDNGIQGRLLNYTPFYLYA
jgi:hypothetical protein